MEEAAGPRPALSYQISFKLTPIQQIVIQTCILYNHSRNNVVMTRTRERADTGLFCVLSETRQLGQEGPGGGGSRENQNVTRTVPATVTGLTRALIMHLCLAVIKVNIFV